MRIYGACEFTTGATSWWSGFSSSTPPQPQHEYDDNPILVSMGKCKYIQIGATIEHVTFTETIESYWSPVSSKGDIPQPLIVGKTKVCFADVEDVQEVPKKLFPKGMSWCDAPLYYLGQREGLPVDMRKYS